MPHRTNRQVNTMAKVKKTDPAAKETKEAAPQPTTQPAAPEAKHAKPAAAKAAAPKPAPAKAAKGKAAAARPAAAPSSPLIDTNLAAESAARMLTARATGPAPATNTGERKETSTFKQLKESLAKPHSASMSNLLNST